MSTSSHRRFGFTLVELLVVITIIGMLVALLIPAVQAARERMLQAQCLNNLTNIGKAMINHSSSRGKLPGYVQSVERIDKTYVMLDPPGALSTATYSPTANPQLSRISWAARILSQLDRNDIWDRLVDPATPAGDLVRPLDLFVCPKDFDAASSPDNAALTYVANTGAWDWDDTGDYFGDAPENGLLHNLLRGRTTSRLGNIKDGSSTTLMLSENINKNSEYSWLGVAPNTPPDDPPMALHGGEQHFGMVWVASNPPRPLTIAAPPADIYDQWRIGEESSGGFQSNWPWYARPTSNHPAGAFNVIFADGSGGNLQPDIDYTVYQRLLTTYGSRCVDPQDSANPAIVQFRALPPLSERDYQ